MEKRIPIWLLASILVIAFIGFFDAVYLTTNHYSGTIVPCFVTTGCEQVTTSSYSLILGIPVALLGTLYYLSILFLGMLYGQKRNFTIFKLLSYASFFGFGFSLWFIYVQAHLIGAWCMYCLISATTSTLIFLLSNARVYGREKLKNTELEGIENKEQE